MFAAVLMMTGCSKIKTNKLIGWWSCEPYQYGLSSNSYLGRPYVYEFINSNTVVSYGTVRDKIKVGSVETPVPNHPGWYYPNKRTWTYLFEDNKVIIYIGDEPKIYTFMDDKLYYGSEVLERW